MDRPPMGCSPYYVNISARICELCEAIKRASTDGSKKNDKIKLWASEIQLLNEVDRTMRRLEKEKTWFEDRKGELHEDRDD